MADDGTTAADLGEHDGALLAFALAQAHVDLDSLTPEQVEAALAELKGDGEEPAA